MGYIRHHALIVTTFDEELAKKAHEKADGIFKRNVSGIIQSPVNQFFTFLVGPDGSKEGWEASSQGNEDRELFVKWLNKQAYEDGSNALNFIELFYGDDEKEAGIVNHN